MHSALARCKSPSAGTTALTVMTVKTIAMPAALPVGHLCALKERSSSVSKLETAIKAKRWKIRSISATIKWPIPSNRRSLLQQFVYRLLLVHKPILVYRPAPGKSKVIRISTLCKPMPIPIPTPSPSPLGSPSDGLCTPWKTTLLRRAQPNSMIMLLATTWRARLLPCLPLTTWGPHPRGQCL